MSAKHLKLIALALVVVLLLWGGSELFSRGSDTVTGGLSVPALAQSDVDTISVVKGTDSIIVAKSATGWTANGRRAAPDAVNDFFLALRDSVAPELVAQDSSSFDRLNVDSATGRWVRVRRGGKPLLALIVGARGSEYASAYVRRPGDSHVYLWRGRLAPLADRAGGARCTTLVALVFDSIPGAFWIRRTRGGAAGGDAGTLYRMNAWDVDGLTPASRSLAPPAAAKQ